MNVRLIYLLHSDHVQQSDHTTAVLGDGGGRAGSPDQGSEAICEGGAKELPSQDTKVSGH